MIGWMIENYLGCVIYCSQEASTGQVAECDWDFLLTLKDVVMFGPSAFAVMLCVMLSASVPLMRKLCLYCKETLKAAHAVILQYMHV